MVRTLYLHGLGSSGHAGTATGLRDLGVELVAPDYTPQHYHKSMTELSLLIGTVRPQRIIGTSMGGYYALKLYERFLLPTLAVNPCYAPGMLLSSYLARPAWDFVREEPIPFTQAMLDAFEPIVNDDPVRAESEVLIVVGRNDELIAAGGQRAFCRSLNFRYTETPWGHRVGDVALLLRYADNIADIGVKP